MSDFDENPFINSAVDNPFSDSAVQQLTRNSMNPIEVDYNPFDGQSQASKPAPGPAEQSASVLQPPAKYNSTESNVNPSLNPNASNVLNTEALQKRQEELERKEQELSRREEEVRQQSYNVRRNNWPPLPQQCCFQPCFYQDIEVDIPLEFQKTIRHLYYLWMFHGMIMVLNICGGLILRDFTIIGLGVLYVLLFTPFSYLCWFRPVYKAFRSDSSFHFMIFFFMFFFQFVITTIQAIGIPHSGTVGIITAISSFQDGVGGVLQGIFALIIALGFITAVAGDLLLITKIHRMYRSTGASLAKAQQEFTTEFLSNQHVRNAASNVASAAVQSQFNQSNNQNRY